MSVCIHITLDEPGNADDAPKMVTLNTESEGVMIERIGICVECFQERIADADPKPKGDEGLKLIRKLAVTAICATCLEERGYVVEPFRNQ